MRRALRLIGKADARFTCVSGGDTDLAWASMYRPTGLLMPLFPIVYDRTVETTEASVTHQGWRFDFDGRALVGVSSDRSRWLTTSYVYGTQRLYMPAKAERVSAGLLDDARLSFRAAGLVAKGAKRVRACLNTSEQPDRCWYAGLPMYFRSRPLRSGGVRVWVRTEFSYDSRDIVARPDGRYEMRWVVHSDSAPRKP